MTDAQIKALGFTAAEDGLPTDKPHRHAYLLIEDDRWDAEKENLVYALANWDPQGDIVGNQLRRHAGGFVVVHELGDGPRWVNDPNRPNLKLRYWKAMESLNAEGGE